MKFSSFDLLNAWKLNFRLPKIALKYEFSILDQKSLVQFYNENEKLLVDSNTLVSNLAKMK